MKTILLFLLVTTVGSTAHLECVTIQEGIKKIQCKYEAPSVSYDRNVTFFWISPDNPADNRAKTIAVQAGHISVYDFRYFAGRSEGLWNISVIEEENNQTVSVQFSKDSNAAVWHQPPSDPILRKPVAP